MTELPSETMFEILSRLPVKSLARIRCVSKLWHKYIDDPYFIILHGQRVANEQPTPIMLYDFTCQRGINVSFHVTDDKQGSIVIEAKSGPFLEFEGKETFFATLRGSCNGMLYFSQYKIMSPFLNKIHIPSLFVVHPIRKECYELPSFPNQLRSTHYVSPESCWLGFDASTDTFKMVCLLTIRDLFSPSIRAMVHVLGMDVSWRDIPQVPSYPFGGKAVFAHGCLHWLANSRQNSPSKYLDLICFDVRKEEFGVSSFPKETREGCRVFYQLINLHGEVGRVNHYVDHSIEVRVLKQKEWVMHCKYDQKPPLPKGSIKFVGCWNKDGDILIKANEEGMHRHRLFVWRLKSGIFDEVNIVGKGEKHKDYMFMYPASSLSSIQGIRRN